MAEVDGKQYLIILSINPCTHQRLAEIVPRLQSVLKRLSLGDPIEQMFRSNGGDHFGYLIRSKLPARAISATIESPQSGKYVSEITDLPFLSSQDGLAVLELSGDFNCGRGFTRAGTWLQRH